MSLPVSTSDGEHAAANHHQDLIERLAGCQGRVLFVGAADTGKTTLLTCAAARALELRRPVGFVDADMGQSSLGPPATIGMSVFRGPQESFRIRRPDGLAFVGSSQPFGFFIPVVDGLEKLVRWAEDAGASLVLIDTPGLANTVPALRLVEEMLLRLHPQHIVLLEKGRELFPLAQLAAALQTCTLHRTAPSPLAHLKPQSLRKAARHAGFAEYFKGARSQKISTKERAVRSISLLAGRPVSPNARLRIGEMLQAPVIRAELCANRLSVITARPASEEGMGRLRHRFPHYQVKISGPRVLDGLLVGLEDSAGAFLELGIVQSCDFTNQVLTLITPHTHVDAIRMLHFGVLRLNPDGAEKGSIRPGEL